VLNIRSSINIKLLILEINSGGNLQIKIEEKALFYGNASCVTRDHWSFTSIDFYIMFGELGL